ncbi:aminopeptidase [Gudongella oleilytica]|jgi:aminopeptidase|uniref:aminopeptidase n=1 Tax=Gudongella oleilytica TaxID=1582259 RepID=UPI002A370D9F|nr:aminopeptidase [Gudongella oleilytica]MDY0256795.1 aminopeptidase [Gudongella oleilytica]
MSSFKGKMEEYARLLVEVGVNLKPGEPLVISAPVEGAEFVRMMAKIAYQHGCTDIYMNWTDDVLTRLKYENAPLEVFESFPRWKAEPLEEFAKKGGNFIYISAEDPQLLQGIDTRKISANNKASGIGLKEYRNYTMNDINSWCVASIPTISWAKQLFPEVEEGEAVEKLWDAILEATRMNSDDPVEAWKQHIETLKKKVNYLNGKKFAKLHYTSNNGTDLMIELPEGHIWAGGGSVNAKGDLFVANMPTEEVFTLPAKYGVNGVVYSTKPLNYGGNLIDNFSLVFENGKVVDFEAKTGHDLLAELLDMDEGSRYLGEVALVPYSSPIERAGILFMNTLFDENAACHLALGKAYPTCIEGGPSMNEKELEAHEVNDSFTHEDFMIGTSDLSIVGITQDGEEIEVFMDGEWAV